MGVNFRKYTWVPLNPKMDNQNSKAKSYSQKFEVLWKSHSYLSCFNLPAKLKICWIQNLVLLFRIKREDPVSCTCSDVGRVRHHILPPVVPEQILHAVHVFPTVHIPRVLLQEDWLLHCWQVRQKHQLVDPHQLVKTIFWEFKHQTNLKRK